MDALQLCLCTCSLLLFANPSFGQVPRPELAVDLSDAVGARTSVASDGGHSAMAYAGVSGGFAHVWVVRSNGDGLNWTAPVQVSTTPGGVESWSLHLVGEKIYVAWFSSSGVYFNRFDGVAWEGEQRIADGGLPGEVVMTAWHMDVSEGPSGIHVVFAMSVLLTENGARFDQVLVTSSQDGGGSFVGPVPVLTTQAERSVRDVKLAVRGDEGFLVWMDDRVGFHDLYLRTSEDGGATWEGLKQVNTTTVPESEVNRGVAIDVVGEKVVIAWKEERPGTPPGANSIDEVHATVSDDGGATLAPAEYLGEIGEFTEPGVKRMTGGRGVVLWSGVSSTSGGRMARYDDGDWGAAEEVGSGSTGFYPKLVGAGDTVVGMWVDSPDVYSIYSLDQGQTYSEPIKLNTTPAFLTSASVAWNADSENAIGSWSDLEFVAMPPYIYESALDAMVGGYSLCNPATVSNRVAGTNVQTYAANPLILGAQWTGTMDPQSGYDAAFVFGYLAPDSVPFGTDVILVELSGPQLFGLVGTVGSALEFELNVPNQPSLCGLELFTQGVYLGAGQLPLLTNAQDLVIGAFAP